MSESLARLAPPAGLLALLGAAYLRTLAPGITWANDGADSGDLAAAAARLGVAHPTGYPTYLLVARLFQLIPIGDLAYRTTLLSAAAAALAALCVYVIARDLIAMPGWAGCASALAAALLFGLSPVLWSQAVIAEVYGLNTLFVALLLLFTLQILTGQAAPERVWLERGQALLVGLALGVHITIALVAAVWLGVAVLCLPRERLLRRALWAGAGLLVYVYVPLRAAAHPPINWGGAQDVAGFWWLVSGALYRPLAFGLPRDELGARIVESAKLLRDQFGVPGLALGLVGLLYGRPRARLFMWLGAAVALIYAAFAIAYNTADSYPYMIPAFLIFATWIGLGIVIVLSSLPRWPAAPVVAVLVLAAYIGWHAALVAPQVDASHDHRAIDFAERALALAPPRAVLVATTDLDAFPLWYEHYALGRRPDLVVLVDPLLDFEWYRRNLRFTYPALAIPGVANPSWFEAFQSANPGLPFCRTNPEAAPTLACEPPGAAP